MCFLCYFLHNAKSNIPSPCAESFEVLQTSIQRTQVAVSHKLIKSLPLRGISSGRRGAAPYLYTQSVCAACFASILRRQSRSMAFPDGNIYLLLKKQDKNTGCRPLPVHANRVCRLLREHSQAAKPPHTDYAHDARKNTPYGGVPWIKTRKSCKRSA